MDCSKMRVLINDLLDDIIGPEDKKLLSEHMSSCANCRNYYKNLKTLQAGSANLSRISPPPDLHERVLSSVKKERFKQSLDIRQYIPFRALPVIGTAAAAVLIVFALKVADIGSISDIGTGDFYDKEPVIDIDDFSKDKSDVTSSGLSVFDSEDIESIEEPGKSVSDQIIPSDNTKQQNASSTVSDSRNAHTSPADKAESSTESAQSYRASGSAEESHASDNQISARSVFDVAQTPSVSTASSAASSTASIDTSRVGSLVKRRVTFTITSSAQASKASSLFSPALSPSEIRSAFSNANIQYTENEIVINDYTNEYNSLADRASDVKKSLNSAKSTSEISKYSSQLKSLKAEMDAIKSECRQPAVAIRLP